MTVDLSGAIWLAGKKANSHSLIKVVARGAACPDNSWVALAGNRYCAKPLYTGWPLLVDIGPVDGDSGAAFTPCPACAPLSGVLGLAARQAAVFFRDACSPASTAPIRSA